MLPRRAPNCRIQLGDVVNEARRNAVRQTDGVGARRPLASICRICPLGWVTDTSFSTASAPSGGDSLAPAAARTGVLLAITSSVVMLEPTNRVPGVREEHQSDGGGLLAGLRKP